MRGGVWWVVVPQRERPLEVSERGRGCQILDAVRRGERGGQRASPVAGFVEMDGELTRVEGRPWLTPFLHGLRDAFVEPGPFGGEKAVVDHFPDERVPEPVVTGVAVDDDQLRTDRLVYCPLHPGLGFGEDGREQIVAGVPADGGERGKGGAGTWAAGGKIGCDQISQLRRQRVPLGVRGDEFLGEIRVAPGAGPQPLG